MASLVSVSNALRAIGAPQSLLYAGINFHNLQGVPSSPLGAPTPQVARTSYTREARREQARRQLARRSGLSGLVRSLCALE